MITMNEDERGDFECSLYKASQAATTGGGLCTDSGHNNKVRMINGMKILTR